MRQLENALRRLKQFTYDAAGLVPAPGGSGAVRFLREDGSWQTPSGGASGVSSVTAGSTSVTASPTTGAVVVNVVPANFSGIPEAGITNLTTDLAAKAPTTRNINTTAPLTGGGNLSVDHTLAISSFTGSTPGAVPTSPGTTSQFLRADGSWSVPSALTLFSFGPGTDGVLTFDGAATVLGLVPSSNTYTLTRDVYASTLTVNVGVRIKTAGWRIFCSVKLVNNGQIDNNGGDASGQTAGAATASGFYAASSSGAAANGNSGAPSGAILGAPWGATNTVANNGAAGATGNGTGGPGTGGVAFRGGGGGGGGGATSTVGQTGGSGGTVTIAAQTAQSSLWLLVELGHNSAGTTMTASSSGAGGGGGGGATNGAAGGAGAGWIYIAAPVISGTGSILANGGAGGVGLSASTTGSGGGGGGGAGGVLLLVYATCPGTQTTTANGGAGGAGGANSGGHGPGGAGGNGGAGVVFRVNLSGDGT